MIKFVYGKFSAEGLELVKCDGKYYVRYDAGAHQESLCEDELTEDEAEKLQLGQNQEYEVIVSMQARPVASGENPRIENWSPTSDNTLAQSGLKGSNQSRPHRIHPRSTE